ncbi:cation diffusion facilitator transporter [Sphaerisporangium melleum]|uniref:Cation diffusion facilitator transporter n=1 Tax=Sphaerisporangium melleum TaxID=321316 RepID=A0A917R9V1_9ACTN|nr:cation diffusion facilitator family transporter [Sphaerisporangium melleum]GGK96317.1 cation diffusion facilitator transporter [Sphaerisporangium melleum]GII70703.1 cation diffusion facilitator transporter [Sphaerisporangium melleum]
MSDDEAAEASGEKTAEAAGGTTAAANPGQESLLTVVVAALINLAIAVAKLVAGLLSGSAAMLSEAAHSGADTVTEVLLVIAVRRSEHPADSRHPFGHGKAGFFWALMAAGATLVVGAGFSITHGVQTITEGEDLGDLRISYLVLAIAFVLESISFLRAVHQVRGAAARIDMTARRYVVDTPDTALKAVVFEDSAALVGIVVAAIGLFGYQVTGSAVWDGAASIAIGLLLLGVALYLIRANASLLIGQAAPPRLQRDILAEIVARREVEQVVELLTMMLGPNDVLVAAKIDFVDECRGDRLERASDEIEHRLRERFPAVTHVFLDPTPAGPAIRARSPLPDGSLRPASGPPGSGEPAEPSGSHGDGRAAGPAAPERSAADPAQLGRVIGDRGGDDVPGRPLQ